MTASFPSSLSWRRCALLEVNDSHFFSLASTKSLHPSIKIFGAHDEQRPTSTPRWNSSLLNIPRPRSLDSPRYLDPHGGVVRVKSGNSKKIFFAAISNPPWPRHQHIVESLTTASYLSIIWSDLCLLCMNSKLNLISM